jgi:hypothetical protein
MLKMSGFDVLFAAAGNLYLLLALVSICAALWFGKTWTRKLVYAVLVLALFIAPIAPDIYRTVEYRSKLAKAQALFKERCKTAGEKVHRTVENVEGVLLMNIRQSDRPGIQDNPLWSDAALPHEASGDEYIRMFLYWEHDSGGETRGFLNPDPVKAMSRGYQFVDVKQADGTVLRYRLKEPGNRDKTDLATEPVEGKASRYAVDFVNQVNPEDRAHWVAGTTITLTDTQTKEVIATRESYSFEVGLGSKAGARQPWAFAITCPSFSGWDGARTRLFVDQVLKPKQGE